MSTDVIATIVSILSTEIVAIIALAIALVRTREKLISLETLVREIQKRVNGKDVT